MRARKLTSAHWVSNPTDVAMVRRALRTGLWVALLVSLPIMAFPLRGEPILRALGQAPMTSHLAQDYLFGLAWGVMPAL